MAVKLMNIPYGDCEHSIECAVGKVALIYDTYPNALAFGSTGLLSSSRVLALNVLTNASGAGITQAKGGTESTDGTGTVTADTGITVDKNGMLNFAIDDDGGGVTEVFIVSNTGNGRQPRVFQLANYETE